MTERKKQAGGLPVCFFSDSAERQSRYLLLEVRP